MTETNQHSQANPESGQISLGVADLSRVALEPGDTLLVRVHRRISMDGLYKLRRELKEHFPDTDVIVVDEDIEFSVIRPVAALNYRAERHQPPPAADRQPDPTPVPDQRPTVGMNRCLDVLQSAVDPRYDVQCASYEGHLELHESEPLPPIREDKSDGIHQFTWSRDADGNIVEFQELRLDEDHADEGTDG